ncbi:hypothetical protein E1K68_26270 [Pseudomonas sp. B2021]|nr:hypothetical protein [Pseudomonas sp. B2021]
MLVPTLCVVTPSRTLRVPSQMKGDAERHGLHSHAERGNDLPGRRLHARSHALRGNAFQDAPRPVANEG